MHYSGGLLNRGQFSISVGSDLPAGVNFFYENAMSFIIVPDNARDVREDNRPGLICPHLSWKVESLERDLSSVKPSLTATSTQ